MKLKNLQFKQDCTYPDGDTLWYCYIENIGRITILDRMTGFGYRDIETGFKDTEGKFWLASGLRDVRLLPDDTPVAQCVTWIKDNANTCIGE